MDNYKESIDKINSQLQEFSKYGTTINSSINNNIFSPKPVSNIFLVIVKRYIFYILIPIVISIIFFQTKPKLILNKNKKIDIKKFLISIISVSIAVFAFLFFAKIKLPSLP
jgi:hypothetical protein